MEIAGHRLPEGSCWDWEVTGRDPGALRLAADHDLTYHHALEVVFVAPALVSCPLAFQDPVFRAPTAEESARLARTLGETTPVVVAFEADAGGYEPVSCLIAAERVEIRHGLVRRSRRAPDPRTPGSGAPDAPGPPAGGTPRWPGVPLSTD
ncbi:hypothetical protein [Streptomyces malaysiense]|uniref:Uncharacterized protein n=1 Tax=Streptomyces malaysiense TaxID=1428626 RepID=A0A1J4PRJ3_9ACTN|nr:hypothetical protein [Streptomyces malaysiense]OIK23330.1 hypothetical protein VT52_033035 [Streptomyces malaysiense]